MKKAARRRPRVVTLYGTRLKADEVRVLQMFLHEQRGLVQALENRLNLVEAQAHVLRDENDRRYGEVRALSDGLVAAESRLARLERPWHRRLRDWMRLP